MRIATPTYDDSFGGNAVFDTLWRSGKVAVAFRNGEPINRVVLADEERGFLLFYPVTPAARRKAQKTGLLPLKRLTGRIEIVIYDR